MFNRNISILLVWLVFILALNACGPAATPAASKAVSRDAINTGGIVPSEELRVAEYLNYYDQHLPPPVNSTLGLDLRVGNVQVPVEGGTVYLQIGIAAKKADASDRAPLNLAIVIDRSGSMNAPEKMPYVKQSLKTFLKSLAPNDIVALVAFSDGVQVLIPSQKVGDGHWIDNAVQRLDPSGSTNLHAGLMQGFREVDRNFDIRRNNRVILLTDGIANVGVTDPQQIANDARAYTERDIFLSTIGLGHDFNDPLLYTLAKQGRGGYNFIDSAEEIDKVFRKQVVGMLQNVAENTFLLIRPESDVIIESVTGFEGQIPSGTFQIKIGDLGSNEQIVSLVRMRVAPGAVGGRNLARVELRYRDLFSQREVTLTQNALVDASRVYNYDPLRDVEVLRNVTIQRTAEGLKEIDRLYQARQYLDAWNLAYRLEQDLRFVARLTNEDQMYKDADLMRKYMETLAKWVQYQTGRPPQMTEEYRRNAPPPATTDDPPPRGPMRTPTPNAPTIDVK